MTHQFIKDGLEISFINSIFLLSPITINEEEHMSIASHYWNLKRTNTKSSILRRIVGWIAQSWKGNNGEKYAVSITHSSNKRSPVVHISQRFSTTNNRCKAAGYLEQREPFPPAALYESTDRTAWSHEPAIFPHGKRKPILAIVLFFITFGTPAFFRSAVAGGEIEPHARVRGEARRIQLVI